MPGMTEEQERAMNERICPLCSRLYQKKEGVDVEVVKGVELRVCPGCKQGALALAAKIFDYQSDQKADKKKHKTVDLVKVLCAMQTGLNFLSAVSSVHGRQVKRVVTKELEIEE